LIATANFFQLSFSPLLDPNNHANATADKNILHNDTYFFFPQKKKFEPYWL